MATPTKVWTDEDLLRLPRDGYRRELVDGEIRTMSPAGFRHAQVVARVIFRIMTFVDAKRMGVVLSEEAGYRLPNRNLRCPDISFVVAERLPEGAPVGFFQGAPDLAVEVLSPDDRPRDVLDKVGEYLAAGTRLVWIIDPKTRRGAAYRSLTDVREIPETGTLEGEDVLPGFSCPLADILA